MSPANRTIGCGNLPVHRLREFGCTCTGLKRNAAVVLGNIGTADDVELLERARELEPDAMVREHLRWALAHVCRTRAAQR